jgi:hypothetical protein
MDLLTESFLIYTLAMIHNRTGIVRKNGTRVIVLDIYPLKRWNRTDFLCSAGWFLKPNWRKSGKNRRTSNNLSAGIVTKSNLH